MSAPTTLQKSLLAFAVVLSVLIGSLVADSGPTWAQISPQPTPTNTPTAIPPTPTPTATNTPTAIPPTPTPTNTPTAIPPTPTPTATNTPTPIPPTPTPTATDTPTRIPPTPTPTSTATPTPIPDSDNDGVNDGSDLCAATTLPEPTPPQAKKNRFYANANGQFIDGDGNLAGITVQDTGGCSGIQIIDAAGLGNGHRRQGITFSTLLYWIAAH